VGEGAGVSEDAERSEPERSEGTGAAQPVSIKQSTAIKSFFMVSSRKNSVEKEVSTPKV
jgi:hypothetical protein